MWGAGPQGQAGMHAWFCRLQLAICDAFAFKGKCKCRTKQREDEPFTSPAWSVCMVGLLCRRCLRLYGCWSGSENPSKTSLPADDRLHQAS